MVLGLLADSTRQLLNRAMDALAARNDVIANNIANADTPGFKRSQVKFEDSLRQILVDGGRPDADTLSRLKVETEVDYTPSNRLDGNNVNIDLEMSDLAKNSIMYNAVIELYQLKGQIMRSVVSGGNK